MSNYKISYSLRYCTQWQEDDYAQKLHNVEKLFATVTKFGALKTNISIINTKYSASTRCNKKFIYRHNEAVSFS